MALERAINCRFHSDSYRKVVKVLERRTYPKHSSVDHNILMNKLESLAIIIAEIISRTQVVQFQKQISSKIKISDNISQAYNVFSQILFLEQMGLDYRKLH